MRNRLTGALIPTATTPFVCVDAWQWQMQFSTEMSEREMPTPGSAPTVTNQLVVLYEVTFENRRLRIVVLPATCPSISSGSLPMLLRTQFDTVTSCMLERLIPASLTVLMMQPSI